MRRRCRNRLPGLVLLGALFVNPLALALHSLEHHHEDGELCTLGELLYLAATPEPPPLPTYSPLPTREVVRAKPAGRLDGMHVNAFSARAPPLPS